MSFLKSPLILFYLELASILVHNSHSIQWCDDILTRLPNIGVNLLPYILSKEGPVCFLNFTFTTYLLVKPKLRRLLAVPVTKLCHTIIMLVNISS